DPVIGSFLSVDPLSADEKQVWFSSYQFGWNNPIRFNDPSGECPECEVERPNPFKGEVYRSTGGADYVYGKGAWTRQGGTLNEITVTESRLGRREPKVKGIDLEPIRNIGAGADYVAGGVGLAQIGMLE